MKTQARRGLTAAFIVALPLLVGLGYSVVASVGLAGPGSGDRVSLSAWSRVLLDSATWRGVAWTIWVGLASTTLATAGAVAIAAGFRASSRRDRLARVLALIPLPVPHIVAAILGIELLSQSGLLARLGHVAGIVSNPQAMPAMVNDHFGIGLILTLTWKEIPFLALVAMMVLASRSTRLEEAARTLGAGSRAVFRHVTWPVLWRGMLPAVVAVFTFVIGTWGATVLLAPSDPLALPLMIHERAVEAVLSRRAEAQVLVLISTALAVAVVVMHELGRRLAERDG